MPIDAFVIDELAGMLRFLSPREIRWRADDIQAQVARHRHGDHVLVDDFTEANAGIVALGDDVERLVAEEQIETHVRMRLEKTGEQRAAQEALGRRGREDADHASWLGTKLTQSGGRVAHLGDGWCDRCVEPLPRVGEMQASSRALNEGDAKAFLELAQCLAHSRAADAELVSRGAETLRFCHRDEHGQAFEVILDHEAELTTLGSIRK